MRYRFAIWLTVFAILCASLHARELVREFSGNRSEETAEFEVEAPWLVDWWVNSDFPQAMGISISLVDAQTGTHAGYVLKTKERGNGLRLMQQSGRFRFKIDSSLTRWRLKVEQLTRSEAEQYTPKEAGTP